MADLRRESPDREVELWCEDEARLGLKPVARRVWALAGTRPTSNGRHQFVSLFVYGFTAASFMRTLRRANVRTILDVRQRRGVRGRWVTS